MNQGGDELFGDIMKGKREGVKEGHPWWGALV